MINTIFVQLYSNWQHTILNLKELTPLILSEEFKYVLDLLEKSSINAFITGKAGTGKSTLLKLFRKTTKKNVVVLAPTGIAALNVRGQTIHSFFGFAPKILNPDEIHRKKYTRIYENLDMIIIDEISMVRADILDSIDIFLRKNRMINEPFGGVQMIFFGDLFQLPPVVAGDFERQYFNERYDSQYFFSADIITNGWEWEMIELNHVYRQDERRFINLLDAIRMRAMDYDDLEEINQRHTETDEANDFFITLCSRNQTANLINTQQLEKNTNPIKTFNAFVTGSFQSKLYPTEYQLKLKLGAQVMFIKNDPDKKFVNGTIGKIIELGEELVKVIYLNDKGEEIQVTVKQLEWEIIRYEYDQDSKIKTKVLGVFKQFPLKLAWAITIHKSQGKTFDRIIVDLGKGAFEHGQTYVALSRCRSLQGIILKNPIRPQDILVDQRITEFYETKRRY